MNKKEKIQNTEENRKLYRIPSGANYQLRSRNAIYISPSNSLRHELSKCIGAYMLRKWGDIKFEPIISDLLKLLEKDINAIMKEFTKNKANFITEAVPKKEPERRVDLVKLEDNTRFEFETSLKIKKPDCYTIYI